MKQKVTVTSDTVATTKFLFHMLKRAIFHSYWGSDTCVDMRKCDRTCLWAWTAESVST